MTVLDVDPELLRQIGATAAHVGEQAVLHNEAEVVGSVPGLLDTLAPAEPYAYMLKPSFHPDGSIGLPIATTRDEVRLFYEDVRGASDVISEEPIIELRGAWYAFWESVSTGLRRDATEQSEHPLAVLSPVGAADGIAGEIIWPKLPRTMLGIGNETPEKGEWRQRRDLRLQHIRSLECLARGDVDGILAECNDGVASAVRDYVDDTGALVELLGTSAHREYLDAFFAKYDVQSVELIHRIAQTWYLFAELRITVLVRGDEEAGTRAFHTAEIHAPGKDDRLIARTGWGTDLT
jgi:hypothetical protein